MRLGRVTVYPSFVTAVFFVSLFFLYGCVSTGEVARRDVHYQKTAFIDNGNPILSVFLNLKEAQGPAIWMKVSALEILSGQTWVPLSDTSLELNSRDISAGQVFIARRQVEPGNYNRLRITLEKASLQRGDKDRFLALGNPVMEISLARELTLSKHESRALLLTWDVAGSRLGKALFKPVLTVVSSNPSLKSGLAYVACPEINTIYLIRTDTNWVEGAIGVSGYPTYPAMNPAQDKLFVLAADELRVKVIEINAHQVVESFHIPLIIDPGYMIVSPDGLWAYILDNRSSNLFKMDLTTGDLAGRARFNEQPDYLYYMPRHGRLAVTSTLSRNIYLVDVDTLKTVETISTGSSPHGLLEMGDNLYIAEGPMNSVSVYDMNTRQLRYRSSTGFFPQRLLESNNYIYVANREGQSLSVLIPGQLGETSRIALDGRPEEINLIKSRRWLYAADKDGGGIMVIDLTSHRQVGYINLQTKPVGIAVLQ